MAEARRPAPKPGADDSGPDATIIQLGTAGVAGRGSRSRPSAAARGLAGNARPRPSRPGATSQPAGEAPQPQRTTKPTTKRTTNSTTKRTTKQQAPSTRTPEESVFAAGPRTDPTADAPDEVIPPALDLAAVVAELIDAANRVVAGLRDLPGEKVRRLADDPLRTVIELAGRAGVDWHASVEEVVGFIRSRASGTYATDEFGFDPEFTVAVYLPVLRWLAQHWFRVEVRGAENLPATDAALLVSNHAGTLPLDGMILQCIVYDEIGRHVRMLGADLIFATPYSGDLARKTGTTLACQEDAERLLSTGQLVSVYPEGFKGLGKPYADRYKLQRFGRGGFVSAAVRAQVPIVPVSVVGSEEIYPLLSTAPLLARAMGVPYFPITPTFPWLGVLGMIPLPSKWIIQFGEAITTDQLPPGAADDPMVVFNVTDQVRETIQQTLYSLLVQRRSAFF